MNYANLDIYRWLAKDDTRPAIANIHDTGTKTVATDSYRLIEVSKLVASEPASIKPSEAKAALVAKDPTRLTIAPTRDTSSGLLLAKAAFLFVRIYTQQP
jgi:hypothetical protein